MAVDDLPKQSVEELMAAAAGRLLAEADDYAERVATRVNAEVVEFPFPPAVTPQTREAVRSTLVSFVEMAESRRARTSPQIPAAAVAYARTFVHRRVPIGALLRTYLLGYRELWLYWVEAVRAEAESEQAQLAALDAGAPIFFAFVDGLTSGIVEVFEAEQAKWSRSMGAIRTELVEAILEGRDIDVEEAERIFVYRLGDGHVGVVVWSEAEEVESQQDRLDRTWQELAERAGVGQSLVVYAGRRVIWGWFGGPLERLTELADALADWKVTQDGVGVALGEPSRGLDGFRDTHRQALHARRVATMAGPAPSRAVRFKRLAVPALTSLDPALSSYFVRHQLGPLAADDDVAARLRGTLEVFFDERENAAATGRRLGIHPNTVAYRLRQIEELLGYPPDDQRLELHLALRLIRYTGAAEDGPGG